MTPLLLDMGLPRRAAGDLRELGWDAVHVGEIGMSRASDVEILDRAAKERRVVVTLDGDFARRIATGKSRQPSLIHVRLQRVDRRLAVRLLTEVAPKIQGDLSRGCIASVTQGRVRVRPLPIV